MASTRVAPLARWSVAAAVALMGAALIVTAWTTRTSVRDARDTLIRGERAALEQAVRADLAELDGPPTAADLAAVLDAEKDAGLRYIAIYNGARPIAEAGASSPSRQRIEIRARRRHGARVVIELDDVEAGALDAAATRTLGIGVAAAAILLVVAAFLFRWVLRAAERERERERERRLASLGELSAVLAHEIRNPLASLKGNAQLLASMISDDKPKAKAARVVDEAVRLETLTNELLEFVRTGELRRAPIDPSALLRDSAAAVSSSPELELDTSAAPERWSLDEARLRQVLINLIENAVAAGAPVRAIARTDRDTLVFEIIDHGPGVAADDAERIFEPFFTKKTSGTGLGLAVAKRVVEQHGGTIAVDRAPNAGARFRVTLPRDVRS
ncbi:MAG TPA: HAMP domain-containing sensor histidine kinase [Kofleriaceae bacterium]|nr:HAMP domain-containing sensor histidine kinase [Kofleriaceae bacterium]